jgi:hypothetical protein
MTEMYRPLVVYTYNTDKGKQNPDLCIPVSCCLPQIPYGVFAAISVIKSLEISIQNILFTFKMSRQAYLALESVSRRSFITVQGLSKHANSTE